ncbi:MAG: endonuclease/exonuclease/phosphatase family protein [Paludibacter sp.]|nr:endonuclease/exonuclease/phosphatase family protein [Paludibacter sp.]MDD4428093.1 endonuclease/exonuclease/phosphatase family protein [Paludibacter sp.]
MMRNTIISVFVFIFIGCACNHTPYVPTDVEDKTHNNNQNQYNDDKPLLSEIKVLTYNIHFCNPPGQPGVCDIQGIANVIKQIDPDIVMLQEVDVRTGYNDCFLDQAEQIAKLTQLNYQFFVERTRGKGFFGNTILSKHPLKKPNTNFLVKFQPDYQQRILATIIVDLPGVDSIMVASTHLEVFSPENRHAQLDQILDILTPVTMPVIIAGDFNTRPTDRVFFDKFENYFTLTCSGESCPASYYHETQHITIDHIGFKPSSAFFVKSHDVLSQKNASDHYPVIGTLKFNRSAQP